MEPADAFDVESLLLHKVDVDEDGEQYLKIIGVREFLIAKALLEGHKESLGVPVESDRGPVHIFDLCMKFGHTDTALALAEYGVEGCTVQPRHLGPYAEGRPFQEKHRCRCIDQTERCDFCTFGWEIDRGTWMEDWDASLSAAARAAHQAVERAPCLLDFMECPHWVDWVDMGWETFFSADAMARLLDIAILTGDKASADQLSRRCQARPLRRWCADEIFAADDDGDSWFRPSLPSLPSLPSFNIEVMLAALRTGADFHRMRVMSHWLSEISGDDEVPFQAAIFLLEESRWHEIVRLCPPLSEKCGLQRRWRNYLGHHFLRDFGDDEDFNMKMCLLDSHKVQAAGNIGIDLRNVECEMYATEARTTYPSTLLGMAIVCGEPYCAVECLRLGVDETGWEEHEDIAALKNHLRDETNSRRKFIMHIKLLESRAFACRHAAKAAGMAALIASWKWEAAEKGVLIIQLLKKISGPVRSFPVAILNDILCFSMKTPKFVDQLDLWDLVDGWMTSATGIQDEPEVRQESGESCDSPASSDQPGTSSGAAGRDGSPDADVED